MMHIFHISSQRLILETPFARITRSFQYSYAESALLGFPGESYALVHPFWYESNPTLHLAIMQVV